MSQRLASLAMDLEHITSVVNLPLVDFGKLVSLILKAASTAIKFKGQLNRFATYIDILSQLLENQQLSDLRKHQATRRVLEQLDIALIRGCRLISKCKNHSWLYGAISGRQIMMKFREVEEDISKYLAPLPVIIGCNNNDLLQKLRLELRRGDSVKVELQKLILELQLDDSVKVKLQKLILELPELPADQSEKQPEHNLAKEKKLRKLKKATVAPVPPDESEDQPEHNLAKHKERNNKQKEAVDKGKQRPQPLDFVEEEKPSKQKKATVAPVLADESKEQPERNLAKEQKPRKLKKATVASVPRDESEDRPEHNLAKEKNSKQKEVVDEGKQDPQPHDFVKKEKNSKQKEAVDEGKQDPQPHDFVKQKEKRSKQKDKSKEQLPSGMAQDMGNNDGKVTAVLKVNMNCICNGCVDKHYNPIVKKATTYTGVECVGMKLDLDNQIIIVVGRFDAEKLRDHLSEGTEKNKGVDIVSENYNMPIKVGKVLLKFGTVGLPCNCDGCKKNIRDMIYKIKGVKEVCFDKGKNRLIVSGAVDIKELCKVKTEHKG